MDHMAVEAPGRIQSGRRLMVQLVVHDVQQCLSLLFHGLPFPLYPYTIFITIPFHLQLLGNGNTLSHHLGILRGARNSLLRQIPRDVGLTLVRDVVYRLYS